MGFRAHRTTEHFYADLEMFSRASSSPDPSSYMKVYTCQEIPQKANNWTGKNVSRYCNRDYDNFWKKASAELEPETRTRDLSLDVY